MADLERELDEHLRRTETHPPTEEDPAARTPGTPDEMRRLLGAAARLRRVSSPGPGPGASERIRGRVLAHIRQHPRTARLLRSPSLRPAFALLLAALLVLSAGTAAAQAALPGDLLYGWKLTGEQVARALYPDRLGFDIFLTERRAGDLLAAAGEPEEAEATQAFAASIRRLIVYASETERARIRLALSDDHARLQAAGLVTQEVETLFHTLGFPVSGPLPLQDETEALTPTPGSLPTPFPLPTLDLP